MKKTTFAFSNFWRDFILEVGGTLHPCLWIKEIDEIKETEAKKADIALYSIFDHRQAPTDGKNRIQPSHESYYLNPDFFQLSLASTSSAKIPYSSFYQQNAEQRQIPKSLFPHVQGQEIALIIPNPIVIDDCAYS